MDDDDPAGPPVGPNTALETVLARRPGETLDEARERLARERADRLAQQQQEH